MRGILYRDRRHAGRALATRLKGLAFESPVVVALPRGGVPVGYEVAKELGAPLDIGLVRKLGAPGAPEFAIGALGEDGTVVLDPGAVRAFGMSRADLEALIASQRAELERRRERYRREQPLIDVAGRDVILVDDGIATGATATVAARVLRARGASRVIVAVPVSSPGAGEALASQVDVFVSLASPPHFDSVGAWYADFSQTSDQEVVDLLGASRRELGAAIAHAAGAEPVADPQCVIRTRDGLHLPGSLLLPARPRGLVLFVHGSGSSRHSPRNLAVASRLAGAGFATLLFDLLTEGEARDPNNVFDIELLTRRLVDATTWAMRTPELRGLVVGYFGASTGAAAALCAAAHLGETIRAVVSRGGRPDLAGDALERVIAPTLLVVGGNDWTVLALNDEAATRLGGPHEVALVPGAGHLFEEPGALDHVARLAAGWFARHLGRVRTPSGSSPSLHGAPSAGRARFDVDRFRLR
jgi:putative phosphoribosyl transferase